MFRQHLGSGSDHLSIMHLEFVRTKFKLVSRSFVTFNDRTIFVCNLSMDRFNVNHVKVVILDVFGMWHVKSLIFNSGLLEHKIR